MKVVSRVGDTAYIPPVPAKGVPFFVDQVNDMTVIGYDTSDGGQFIFPMELFYALCAWFEGELPKDGRHH